MKVTLKLFNQLRSYAPREKGIFRQTLPTGATVNDLLTQLKIPATVQRTVLVNGRRVDDHAPLCADDEVVLMSPIEGG